MSLINQMLQELDARRSEATGNGSFGQQVRAVYERNRTQPMLWGALTLAGVLVGAGAWFWLRPSAPMQTAPVAPIVPNTPAAPVEQPATLPLKFDAGLNMAQAGASSPASQPQAGTEIAAQAPAPTAMDSKPAQVPPQANSQPIPPDAKPQAAPVEKKAASAPVAVSAGQEQMNAPAKSKRGTAKQSAVNDDTAALPDIAKVVPPAKAMAASPSGKAADQASTPAISKQFKELTPQQRAENEYRKGVASLQQGKSSEAVSSLEQALQLDPSHAAARQTLIGILLENKHKDGAIRRAKDGLVIDAAQPGLAMILARLQLEKGELQPAIDTLERTLPYAVDRADYQAFLAALLQRAERHKEAIEHYFVALQKTPQNGVWWMGVAISLQADRRKPEAIEAFKRAKATNSLSQQLLEFVDAQLAQLQQR